MVPTVELLVVLAMRLTIGFGTAVKLEITVTNVMYDRPVQ